MEINGMMLRAMTEELAAIQKEAAMDKEAIPALGGLVRAAGTVGSKLLRGAKSGVGALARQGGTVGNVGQRMQGGLARATRRGVNYFGGGSQGMSRLKTVVGGGAMLGAGALGTGALVGRATAPRNR